MLQFVSTIVLYLLKALLGYGILAPLICGIPAVYQERSIWNSSPQTLPSLSIWGHLKVYCFNLLWMWACLIGSIGIILCSPFIPFMIDTDDYKTKFQNSRRRVMAHWARVVVERKVAHMVVSSFCGPVQIKGTLPQNYDGNVIYIANHASQIDVGAVYAIQCEFKWIAKSSVTLLPGVGQVMWLGNHVFIDRKHAGKKNSSGNAASVFSKAQTTLVDERQSMFIFPQGTRRMAQRLPFKTGAFRMAIQHEIPLVPMSIHIPLDAWNQWYPLDRLFFWTTRQRQPKPIVIEIHPIIKPPFNDEKKKNDDDQEVLSNLMDQCYTTIYSVLPDLRPESENNNNNKTTENNNEQDKKKKEK